MKKIFALALAALPLFTALTACSSPAGGFDKGTAITVVSREEGSGTRDAVRDLFDVKDADGKENVTEEAITADGTGVMISNVAGNPYAIGYCSVASLNDTVKALTIDGVAATAGNVKNGSYTIQRPFYLATLGEAEGLAKDFIDFILSAEGQAAMVKRCVPIDENAPAYSGGRPSGNLVVGGSSSVTPVMQDLVEAYKAVNPNAAVTIQESDSSKGMNDAKSGAYDIGMASRALKDAEISDGLVPVHIALDGIAVIVHPENPLTALTNEQVRNIYNGEFTKWSGVQ
ncbi:MAG: substrate-binding domain-containing protein [Oscillospiraceae bacterium]|jgi:phosphate transport system substrate-binding protein|nr:substrate-binding domain-containing protein [Oscillospiraceae bacterium]